MNREHLNTNRIEMRFFRKVKALKSVLQIAKALNSH